MKSLRGRFLLLVVGIYVAVGTLAVLGFIEVAGTIIRRLGAGYATQFASQQKSKILAKLERDVVLAQKLVDSPLLRSWALDESSPGLKKQALEELESFRRLFSDHGVFFVVDESKHYYFNNAQDEFRGQELRFTIRRGDPTLSWYFDAMEHISDFALHVDNSAQLGITNVWINAVVKDGDRKIGLGGSGLDLTSFLRETVQAPEPGVETILVDGKGFVQGHSDARRMEANARIKDEARRLKADALLDAEADRVLLRERLARLQAGATDVERFEMHAGGRRVLVAAAYMKSIDWAAVVFVDPAQVIGWGHFLPILVLLAAALLVTILLVSWSLERLVLGRLARLTDSTRTVAAGQYDVSLPVDRPDEIGQLTASFNHMAATVRDYTQNLAQKVAERTSELETSNALLAASNRKVMDSIHYARLIQSSLLAKPSDLSALLPEWTVFWRPRDVVGGDFYAVYPDGEGGLLLAVADCTGHGVPGAFMTMASKALLDGAVADHGMDDPASLLATLNRTVRTLLQHEGAGSHNGLDLALVRLKARAPTLRFAASRLSLWIQAKDGSFTVLRGERESLGYAGSDEAFVFRNHDVRVSRDERVFLLTDGILDQAGGPRGFGLGVRRLQEYLASVRQEPLAGLDARLEELLRAYQGSHPQRDDITLVGFRVEPSGGPG